MTAAARVKKHLRRMIKGIVSRGRRSPLAEWLRSEETLPARVSEPEIFAIFMDSFGHAHALVRGYRDRLKPDWRSMLAAPAEHLTAKQMAQVPGAALASVDSMLRLLRNCGALPRPGGRVLEVGCHLGERAFALAARGYEVTALYLPDYYVEQTPGQLQRLDVRFKEITRLQRLQEQTRRAFAGAGVPAAAVDSVRLLPEDIQGFDAREGSFDAVVSWETLEHIRDPEAGLRQMLQLLAPGGVGYHEYDPFFNALGGHSLCTLDFPYGHARLSEEDFERYLRHYRPEEADVALRFFRHNLNRLSLTQLCDVLARIGYESLAVVPWPERADLDQIDDLTLRHVQRHHPTATLADLLARRVWVVVRKPG